MIFSNFLTEGMIKLPSSMFKEGVSYIVSQACSYALTEIAKVEKEYSTDESKKIEDHIKSIAKKYDAVIKTTRKMEYTKTVLKKVYDDLPEKYKASAKEFKKGLTLYVDWDKSKMFTTRNGYFRNNDEGIIGVTIFPVIKYNWVKNIKNLHSNDPRKRQMFCKEVCDWFSEKIERFIGSYEHELTHFVQFKILPNEKHFNKSKEYNSDADAYYNSSVEFDPTIRDCVKKYLKQEKENLSIGMSKNRSFWISIFVGSVQHKVDPKKDMLDLPDDKSGYVTVDDFFKSLKSKNEKRWKLAVKMFTQEVEKK